MHFLTENIYPCISLSNKCYTLLWNIAIYKNNFKKYDLAEWESHSERSTILFAKKID